uniref:Uncharacterized protein n=1 Tax=Candidatus Kentrum sp. LFY TaxID=2126342 RepID=A0A450X642_9GAMM|nr:MAG: hypothetical protein BECKLFY1418C_GA0070996_11923 [Candidatus Kentron sp. LFY]
MLSRAPYSTRADSETSRGGLAVGSTAYTKLLSGLFFLRVEYGTHKTLYQSQCIVDCAPIPPYDFYTPVAYGKLAAVLIE